MSEPKVEKQKVVSFTYVITDENGSVQEQSDIPTSYIHGVDGKMFEKVEAEMEGKHVGDVVQVTLAPKDAFGERDPSLTYTDSVENVPKEFQQLGAEAMFRNEAGETVTMTVVKIDDDTITLDGNHPYAGRQMTFRIVIQDIRDATLEEVGAAEAIDSDHPPTIH